MKNPDFLHVDKDLTEIKVWMKNIEVSVVKNGCGHSGVRTLKLAISQKRINEINWFLVC